MESWPRRQWAPWGCLTAPWLLGWLLSPWTLQFTGGQSVTHTGPPIIVSLANQTVYFSCQITYVYTPKHKNFTLSYYYVDRQGQMRAKKQTGCQPSVGKENQTHTTMCLVRPKLRDASATGTYYCSVHWQGSTATGIGPFILVRDVGYQEPANRSPQKVLLFCFIGLLSVLSALSTALLLRKKKQMQASQKHTTRKGPAPNTASPEQPPAESLYTALQRRETEVYACMQSQSDASRPPSSGSLPSQENPHRFENDAEFNLVYENL